MTPNDFWVFGHEPICERCQQEIARDAPMVGVFVGDKAIGVVHDPECPE